MITNFDLVVYLGQDWINYHRQRMLLALARRMEGKGQILCVERPVCPLTTAFRHPRKFLEWVARKRGVRQETTNLFVYTPYVLIHDQIASFLPGMVTANRALLSRLLKKVIRQLAFRRPIRLSWIYNPLQIDYPGLVGEAGYVYECLDGYTELTRGIFFSRDEIKRREIRLAREAAIVFATARQLYEREKEFNPRTFYVPNGVDLPLFQQFRYNGQAPDDLNIIPHPRLGFVGRLDNAFVDCDLIEAVVRLNPAWSFVFIGPITVDPSAKRLQSLPNVFFLGYRPYELLPAYIGALDVGLIPFRINQITQNLNPLKLYEYMAAGCPVVSTDVPEVRQYVPLVRIARNSKEFVAALQSVIDSDSSQLRQALREEAKQHSWDVRVEEMIEIIQKYAI